MFNANCGSIAPPNETLQDFVSFCDFFNRTQHTRRLGHILVYTKICTGRQESCKWASNSNPCDHESDTLQLYFIHFIYVLSMWRNSINNTIHKWQHNFTTFMQIFIFTKRKILKVV